MQEFSVLSSPCAVQKLSSLSKNWLFVLSLIFLYTPVHSALIACLPHSGHLVPLSDVANSAVGAKEIMSIFP
jgi:hypothetical protein